MSNTRNIFNEKDINKKIFNDRWVKFAFGPQGKIRTKQLNLGITRFSENKDSKTHKHNIDEALFILSGNGEVKVGNEIYKVKENDFIYVPKNTNHTITTSNRSKIKILFVFAGKIVISY